MSMIRSDIVSTCARECDLGVVGVLSCAEYEVGGDVAALKAWQGAGFQGEMGYMGREAELFGDLAGFLPGARSVVSFFVPYLWQSEIDRETLHAVPPEGYGKIARYAWMRDYHRVLKLRLEKFVVLLKRHFGDEIKSRIFVDSAPILERSIARASKIGFVGKNTLFIRPGLGSYGFLCEVVLNIDIAVDIIVEAEFENNLGKPKLSGCGTCTKCINDCPTNAIVAPYLLDARRCISYLTIEKRTEFTEWEREAIGYWLFGCDRCQEVCPYNHRGIAPLLPPADFQKREVGHYLSLTEVLKIRTDKDFMKRFEGTPIMRARRVGLLRNACAVIGNTNYCTAISALVDVSQDDPSELVRNEADCTLQRLNSIASGLDRRRIAVMG